MSAAKTQTVGKRAHAPESAKQDLRNLEKVRAVFASLPKYIRAKTMYTSNNPNVGKFADVFYETFRILFEHEKELVLAIEQYQIKWRDEVVYDNNEKNASIAFLLFKDGVGEITIYSAVKQAELDQFADLIKNEIYNPSAHLDIVSRLWQAEFKNIHYRVFDESTDGASGEGGKSGSDSQEQPLRANDHRSVESADNNDEGKTAQSNNPFRPLWAYLSSVVEHNLPNASAREKEEFLQSTLDSFFKVSAEELESWREEFFAATNQDKLLWLLDVMVDFTQIRSTPSVTRDIMDMANRVVRSVIEEARIPALITLLDIQKEIAENPATVPDFQFLPEQIYQALTDNAFLVFLGKKASTSHDEARKTLPYFQLLGKIAVPGICELRSNSKDPLTNKDACDALITMAGIDIMSIINDLDLDSPHEAKDAIYLLRRAFPGEIPPLIKQILSSPDAQVRAQVIDLLAEAGTDEAALLLSRLIEDEDTDVRIKAFAAAENVAHPAVVDKIAALCFDSDTSAKGIDELERMFRAIGILAGEKVLAPLTRMTKRKGWIPLGKSRSKQDKLLAITALRHIPGRKSLELLRKLADDHDSLVRSKASYVLKRTGKPGDEPALSAGKEAE